MVDRPGSSYRVAGPPEPRPLACGEDAAATKINVVDVMIPPLTTRLQARAIVSAADADGWSGLLCRCDKKPWLR